MCSSMALGVLCCPGDMPPHSHNHGLGDSYQGSGSPYEDQLDHSRCNWRSFDHLLHHVVQEEKLGRCVTDIILLFVTNLCANFG